MKRGNPTKPTPLYVLDTSALITYLAGEPGADKVQELHARAALPFMALTELYYVAYRQQGEAAAEEAIQHVLSWHLPVFQTTEQLSIIAGRLKARHRLGIADSYIAALALAHQLTLVTQDQDFRAVAPHLKLLYLS